MNSTKSFSFVGVKSGYLGFQCKGLRGTIYVPKGFFAANSVPQSFDLVGPFVEPTTKESVDDLKAQVEALKAALAAAAPVVEPKVEEPKVAEKVGKLKVS